MKEHTWRLRWLVAIFVALLLAMCWAAPALAAEVRTGPTLTIGEGEVIDEDLFMFGGAIMVDGTINGDIFAAAGSITINGQVNGSIYAAAGTIIVNGKVARAIRVAGGLVKLDGEIGGDVMLVARDLKVTDATLISGNLFWTGGDAQIGGTIDGDVGGVATEVTISGLVKGNVDLNVDALTLLPTARIEGGMCYTCEKEVEIQPGAQVVGGTTHNLPKPVEREITREPSPLSKVRDGVMSFLSALVLGIVVIAAFQRRTEGVVTAMRRDPWSSLGWGALLLVAVPVAIVVVGVTIIGIPLALIILALYILALYLSQVLVGLVLGQCMLGRPVEGQSRAAMVGALALGLAVLVALRSIPLPYVWAAVWVITILFGVGALILSEWRGQTKSKS